MKYVALMTGKGEGCDYTIGCNKKFAVFGADDDAAAIKYCKKLWDDHGGNSEKGIETIELYAVGSPVKVPVEKW